MESDISDLLEDISDLDNQLLGGRFSSTDTKTVKKTVKFNEGDDDILGDLLSDSDGVPKKQIENSANKNAKISDLFGIKSQTSGKPNLSNLLTSDENKVELNSTVKFKSDDQLQDFAKSIINTTDNNVKLKSSIGIDETKKSNFMEGNIKNTRTLLTADKNPNQSTSQDYSNYDSTDFKINSTTNYSPSRKREPRRGRRDNKTILDDPLGLFSGTNKQSLISDKTNDSFLSKETFVTSSDVDNSKLEVQKFPEWLNGSKQFSKQIPKMEDQKATVVNNAEKVSIFDTSNIENLSSNMNKEIKLADKMSTSNVHTDQLFVMRSTQLDSTNTVESLMQQYEQLGTILGNQRIKLIEQEEQFKRLVKKHIEGQALLEAQVKMQQGQIANYLQDSSKPYNESEAEILIKKLNIEKLHLEKTLESSKENHEKEIFILNESYRKQIQYLEDSIEKLENRLKKDTEISEENFEIRMQQMKDRIFDLEKVHEEEKEQIKMENKKLLQEILERHSHNIDFMRKEFADTIENISKAKDLERTAIDAITSHGRDVCKILENSDTVISKLFQLQEQIEEHDNKFIKAKEQALQKQEDYIEFMKEEMLQEKHKIEDYRKKISNTTQMFESQLILMTSEFKKRMTQLIEMEDNLKIRENSIVKEREFLMEQSRLERTNVQKLKDMWNHEQAEQARNLANERENITMERAKLNSLSKIPIKLDEVNKRELELSIKAAQEATESIVCEKKLWQQRLAELEAHRNSVLEKENRLISQAKHLEELTQLALTKQNEGRQALKRAEQIEQMYKEKFQQLQVQLEILDERENKIAADKIILAREKINLHSTNFDFPEKDEKPIKLSKEELNDEFYITKNSKPQFETYFKDIIDPKLLLLKINLNNKLTEYK